MPAGAETKLVLSPAESRVEAGEVFRMTVALSSSEMVDFVALHLPYDASVLRVAGLELPADPAFPDVLVEPGDADGTIVFEAGSGLGNPPVMGTEVLLLTIQWEALAPVVATELAFDTGPFKTRVLVFSGNAVVDVLETALPATVRIDRPNPCRGIELPVAGRCGEEIRLEDYRHVFGDGGSDCPWTDIEQIPAPGERVQLTAGGLELRFRLTDDCGIESECRLQLPCAAAQPALDFCMFGQGYWANHNDHPWKYPDVAGVLEPLGGVLPIGPLTFDAACIDVLLPGKPHHFKGNALERACNSMNDVSFDRDNVNSLLRHTITLALNVAYNPGLADLRLRDLPCPLVLPSGLDEHDTVADLLTVVGEALPGSDPLLKAAVVRINGCFSQEDCDAGDDDDSEDDDDDRDDDDEDDGEEDDNDRDDDDEDDSEDDDDDRDDDDEDDGEEDDDDRDDDDDDLQEEGAGQSPELEGSEDEGGVEPELAQERELRLYPNPAVGILQVFWEKLGAGELIVRIASAQGGLMELGRYEWYQRGQHLSLDISRLPPGVYYLMLNQNGRMRHRQFIKLGE